MKRILIARLFLLATLIGSAACEKQATEPASTAATATTPTQTITATTDPDPGVPPNGSVVRIDFDNAISHILEKSVQNRAVLIKADKHTSYLTIMYSTDADQQVIQDAFGKDIPVDCKERPCRVTLPANLTLRMIGEDKQPVQPTPVKPTPEFAVVVPALRTVGNLAELNEEAKAPLPSVDFKVFFDFNGGRLSARPCTTRMTLKYKTKSIEQLAADLVTLSGITERPAVLEITRLKSVSTLKFRDLKQFEHSKLVWLVVDNAPDELEKHDHFSLHQKMKKKPLSGQPAPDFPTVENWQVLCLPQKHYDDERGVTVACGNTQWP